MTSITAFHDGRAGNARQANALARALLPDAGEHRLLPCAPWCWLAPRALPGAWHAFGPAFEPVLAAPPGVAIGCGRQAALATRLLGHAGSHGVQILDPRISPRHWDLVVAPAHDGLHGDNVITMQGSLHPVDDAWLAQARAAFPAFASFAHPHTVLLVGGPSPHAALDDAGFAGLLRQLAAHTRTGGGSFSAVASRRTPPAWREALGTVDAALPGLRWRDARDGPNAYAGLLAHADRIVCTPDSVNMLSEAAATRVPVFAWGPQSIGGRPRRFVDALLASGRLRALEDGLASYAAEPLRETMRIADEVKRRLGLDIG